MTHRLDERCVVRFIGDLHLGDGAHNDAFGDKDALLVGLLEEWAKTSDAVVFMGDAIDIPQAFSVRRVARAHPRVMQAIDALSRHTQVVFVRGNHDWHVDYSSLFPRATMCSELMIGGALVIHGHQLDRYCDPCDPLHAVKIGAHHLVERVCRFAFRVPLAAHDTWQNRIAHRAGYLYGRWLRGLAHLHRAFGADARAAENEEFIRYWSRTVWGDPHALFAPVARRLARDDIGALICGHTHLCGVVEICGRTYVNAGSWTYRAAELATWDGARYSACDRASGAAIGDDLYRWMLTGHDPGDFFTWWRVRGPTSAAVRHGGPSLSDAHRGR